MQEKRLKRKHSFINKLFNKKSLLLWKRRPIVLQSPSFESQWQTPKICDFRKHINEFEFVKKLYQFLHIRNDNH